MNVYRTCGSYFADGHVSRCVTKAYILTVEVYWKKTLMRCKFVLGWHGRKILNSNIKLKCGITLRYYTIFCSPEYPTKIGNKHLTNYVPPHQVTGIFLSYNFKHIFKKKKRLQYILSFTKRPTKKSEKKNTKDQELIDGRSISEWFWRYFKSSLG